MTSHTPYDADAAHWNLSAAVAQAFRDAHDPRFLSAAVADGTLIINVCVAGDGHEVSVASALVNCLEALAVGNGIHSLRIYGAPPKVIEDVEIFGTTRDPARPKHTAEPAGTSVTWRDERRLRALGLLLPAPMRERQVDEWLDNIGCAREAGEDGATVRRSITVRSVIPIALQSRARNLRRALARSRR